MLLKTNSTTSAGNWTAVNAATLHAALAKEALSLNPYIAAVNTNTTGILGFETATISMPFVAGEVGCYFSQNAAGGNQRGITINFRYGTTVLATHTNGALTELISEFIAPIEFNEAYVDYSLFNVELVATGQTGGGPAGRRDVHVYWAYMTLQFGSVTNLTKVYFPARVANADLCWSNLTGTRIGYNSRLFTKEPLDSLTPFLELESSIYLDGVFVPSSLKIFCRGNFLPTPEDRTIDYYLLLVTDSNPNIQYYEYSIFGIAISGIHGLNYNIKANLSNLLLSNGVPHAVTAQGLIFKEHTALGVKTPYPLHKLPQAKLEW